MPEGAAEREGAACCGCPAAQGLRAAQLQLALLREELTRQESRATAAEREAEGLRHRLQEERQRAAPGPQQGEWEAVCVEPPPCSAEQQQPEQLLETARLPLRPGRRVAVPDSPERLRAACEPSPAGWDPAMAASCGRAGDVVELGPGDGTVLLRFSGGAEWWFPAELFAPLPPEPPAAHQQRAPPFGSAVAQYHLDTSVRPGALVRTAVDKEVWVGDVVQVEGDTVEVHRAPDGEPARVPRLRVQTLCGAETGPPLSDAETEFARDVIAALRGEQGAYVNSALLPPEEAAAAAAEARQLAAGEEMHQGGTGAGARHRRDGKLRGDEIRWLPKNGGLPPALQRLVHRCSRLRKGLAQVTGRPLPFFSLQLSRFPGTGTGFVRHRDSKLNDPTDRRRRVTLTYYFNTEWEEGDAGELVVFPRSRLPQLVELHSDTAAQREEKRRLKGEGALVVEPRSNTFVAFQSHILHEVRAERSPRLALSVFIAGSESLGLTHPDAPAGVDIDSWGPERSDIYPSV
eukprot:TRINITY_DN7075_c0_g1_i1.p1 TRINITY_DN7075_c0_g1~~TRINITY_DN7075_c0_g1_i1.p1  ORF type:complete len:539 (+),score=183.99 TRINITY_DN7075_c0_g1_i1:68-1618(+)